MTITPSYGPLRSTRTKFIAWACVSMLLLMLLAQLFSYEDFASILGAVLPFDDQPLTTVLAACIVFAELLSLPYLLGMYISKLMRVCSALFAGLSSLFWLILSLTSAHAGNSGLFSTTIKLPGGLLAAAWGLILFGLYLTVVFADSRFRHDESS